MGPHQETPLSFYYIPNFLKSEINIFLRHLFYPTYVLLGVCAKQRATCLSTIHPAKKEKKQGGKRQNMDSKKKMWITFDKSGLIIHIRIQIVAYNTHF